MVPITLPSSSSCPPAASGPGGLGAQALDAQAARGRCPRGRRRRHSLLRRAGLALVLLLAAALPVRAQTVLRVGVLDGSPPCSSQQGRGRWQGSAVDLWGQVAGRERLAFVYEPYPTARALLEASRLGAVDVGVGCLTVTPERLDVYRFSLPFQEAGIALMLPTSRLATVQALLLGMLDPKLLGLLAGYLLAIGLVSVVVWRIEGGRLPGERAEDPALPRWPTRAWWRRYTLVFQVLATGPGTNTVVSSSRGHGLVLLSYLIRLVFGSLIVSTFTLDVLRQVRVSDQQPSSLAELAGLRVAARPGSVSEKLLRSPPLRGRVTVVPLARITDAPSLLLEDRVDAVLADEQQLRYVRDRAPGWQRNRLQLVLEGERPESQAFVFSPLLPQRIADGIDRAISEAKRDGLVR